METPNILLPFDPFTESSRCLVIVVFFKSRSEFFKRACLYATTAFDYQILHNGSVHCARFAPNLKEATAAYGLITCLDSWKGNKIHLLFAGGRMLRDHRMLREVLPCYIASCSVEDKSAYCCKVEEHPFDRVIPARRVGAITVVEINIRPATPKVPVRHILNPCKLLNLDNMSPHHPADVRSQIHARAIEMCVDWCPNFATQLSKLK